jgi:apolipoprotein N-acyltransferase
MYLLALEAKSARRAALNATALFIFGGFPAAHWLVYPMINFGQVPLLLACVFIILLGLCLSVYHIAFALLLRFFHARLPLALALPACALTWGALEYARGRLCTGITWFSLSSAMPGAPIFAQGASLFGMFGLSALYVFIALCCARLLPGSGHKLSLPGRLGCLAAIVLVSIPLIVHSTNSFSRDFAEGEAVIIAQAQGNIDQAEKWLPAMQETTVRHYLELSRQAMEEAETRYGHKAQLLVWPETAMPFYFQDNLRLARPLRDLAARHGIPLLFGLPGRGDPLDAEAKYNRVWLLDRQGADAGYYDKEHLVPFGEYLPKGIYVPFASEFLQGTGFNSGRMEEPLRLQSLSLGVLICYEGIFPELAQARVEAGANLLVNVSNDAWFADSPAPWQHLQLSAMRAVEQGRYMIRSTNTGASALIDPAGRILDVGPLFQDHAGAHQARLLRERTFFSLHYAGIHRFLVGAPLFFAALAWSLGRRRRKQAGS